VHGEDPFVEDVAAYALGALEPAEAEALQRHLVACAVCSDELSAFEAASRRLADSVPVYRAPSALRRRVLSEVCGGGRRSSVRSRRTWGIGVLRGVALAAAVVSAVVAVVDVTGTRSAPARVYRASVGQASGRAWVRVAAGHGELVVRDLAQPAAGEVYEVWLQRRHGRPQPTSALFGVTTRGSGDVAVPGSLRGVVRLIVTQEPVGGSRTPTLPAIISAQLA